MKLLKKITAVALAGAITLGMSASVFAAGPEVGKGTATTPQGSDLAITKTLKIGQGITVPTEVYNFTFEQIKDADSRQQDIAIPDVNISFSEKIRDKSSAKTELVRQALIDASALTSSAAGAGQYKYKVTETAGSTTGMTYSQEEYSMYFTVINDTTQPNGLKLDNVTVVKENGTPGEGTKVNAATTITDKTTDTDSDGTADYLDADAETPANAFNFTNTFTKMVGELTDNTGDDDYNDPEDVDNAAFKLENQTEGKYGDKKAPVDFDVVITYPETADKPETITGVIVNENNEIIGTVTLKEDSNGDYVPVDGSGNPVKIGLADGEAFEIGTLPAGTTIKVTEDKPANTDVTYAGTNNGETISGSTNNVNLVIGDNASSVTFTNTNTLDNINPTGIIMNNAPYMAVGIAAIGLMLLMVAGRRRKAEEE